MSVYFTMCKGMGGTLLTIKTEIAVVVGDYWQGKGIGATLMEHLLAIAKERGMEFLWGAVLAENSHVLAMARKLGFEISWRHGFNHYEIKIDLRSLGLD